MLKDLRVEPIISTFLSQLVCTYLPIYYNILSPGKEIFTNRKTVSNPPAETEVIFSPI